MGKKLHRGQQEAIAAFARVCEVQKGGFFGPWVGAEVEQLRDQIANAPPWKQLLSETDILPIIFRHVYRQAPSFPEDYVGLLQNAPEGLKWMEAFEDDITSYLESLPRPYHVYFPLVSLPRLNNAEVELSDGIAVVDTSSDLGQDSRALSTANDLLVAAVAGHTLPQLKEDTRYLRFTLQGYADASPESSTVAPAIAQLKHFLFLGVTQGLLDELPIWHNFALGRERLPPPAVVRHVDPGVNEAYVLSLPEEFYRYLLRVIVRIDRLCIYDTASAATIFGGAPRTPNSPEEVAESLCRGLKTIVPFVSLPSGNRDAMRIKAAIEWWVDANASQNQTISFLQLCIGFEALLGGDVQEAGVTTRLADRFAYLLGETESQRQSLRGRFRGVYQRRGNIVHQREVHLRGNDNGAREEARDMLKKAILHEIRQLMKTIDGRSLTYA